MLGKRFKARATTTLRTGADRDHTGKPLAFTPGDCAAAKILVFQHTSGVRTGGLSASCFTGSGLATTPRSDQPRRGVRSNPSELRGTTDCNQALLVGSVGIPAGSAAGEVVNYAVTEAPS
jgi:hypothetical protein